MSRVSDKQEVPATVSNGILRRNYKGIKSKDWCNWPPQPLEDMESTIAIQQYIQQQIRLNPDNVEATLEIVEKQDENVWIYEHFRQLCLELNDLVVELQEVCKPSTCPQMIATDQWIFLCAAHKNPKECSAIDYARHTLDGAASFLNNVKYFPSRLIVKKSSITKLVSACRRVYRIFSHTYFHHRNVFDEFEAKTHLCERFTLFVIRHKIMTKDALIVPVSEEVNDAEESSS